MKVSVALCTYNGEKFLKAQIDSILFQTQKVDEIIVCDDKSSDSTIAILENYKFSNPDVFKIYKNEVNLRSVKNFEKAISLCTGDIIFLSDQDDIWVENKVEKYIEYFENHPTIDVLASNGYCIDENSTMHEKYSIWDVPQFLRENGIRVDYFAIIGALSNIATGASIAIRKTFVVKIIPFPEAKNYHHDEWIALVAAEKNNFELLNEKYWYYRIHNKQQVGGVFCAKKNKNKNKLVSLYRNDAAQVSFNAYKRRLRKISTLHNTFSNICTDCQPHKIIIQDNKISLKKSYLLSKKEMAKFYPIRYFLLKCTDHFLSKRKINF